jgi:Leucine Rich repeat
LGNNNIGDAGASVLAGGLWACPDLQELELSGCGIGAVGAEVLAGALRACPALQVLDLSENQIGEVGVEALAKYVRDCPNLQKLDLDSGDLIGYGPALASLLDSLKLCSNLRHLVLPEAGGELVDAVALTEVIRACPLQTLSLDSCGILHQIWTFPPCPSLRSFSLSRDIGDAGFEALAKGLRCCPSLWRC